MALVRDERPAEKGKDEYRRRQFRQCDPLLIAKLVKALPSGANNSPSRTPDLITCTDTRLNAPAASRKSTWEHPPGAMNKLGMNWKRPSAGTLAVRLVFSIRSFNSAVQFTRSVRPSKASVQRFPALRAPHIHPPSRRGRHGIPDEGAGNAVAYGPGGPRPDPGAGVAVAYGRDRRGVTQSSPSPRHRRDDRIIRCGPFGSDERSSS